MANQTLTTSPPVSRLWTIGNDLEPSTRFSPQCSASTNAGVFSVLDGALVFAKSRTAGSPGNASVGPLLTSQTTRALAFRTSAYSTYPDVGCQVASAVSKVTRVEGAAALRVETHAVSGELGI